MSLCLLYAQAESRRQVALHSPILNIVLVFVIHLVSGFKSVISDSCAYKRTNRGSPPGGLGMGLMVWLRQDRGLSGRVGPRAGEGTTDGQTRQWDMCAFCLFLLAPPEM